MRSMSDERFTLDTNILVYSVDSESGRRHQLASEIVELSAKRDCWITLQAVSEFYAVVSRKHLVARTTAAMLAHSWLDLFPSAVASESAVHFAIDRSADGRVSYWDALLIAAAAEAGCTAIVTEDLTDGVQIKGVRVVHPFAAGGLPEQVRSLLGMGEAL
jgi:predicted nucleic acid-binding protein